MKSRDYSVFKPRLIVNTEGAYGLYLIRKIKEADEMSMLAGEYVPHEVLEFEEWKVERRKKGRPKPAKK